jgi:phage baseplate assembly protein V
MNQLAELARLIENLVRLGTIAEVDVAKVRVRVKSGSITTNWLPWLALRAGTLRNGTRPPSASKSFC